MGCSFKPLFSYRSWLMRRRPECGWVPDAERPTENWKAAPVRKPLTLNNAVIDRSVAGRTQLRTFSCRSRPPNFSRSFIVLDRGAQRSIRCPDGWKGDERGPSAFRKVGSDIRYRANAALPKRQREVERGCRPEHRRARLTEVTDADRWRLATSLSRCCDVFASAEGSPRHLGDAVSVQRRTGATKESHRHLPTATVEHCSMRLPRNLHEPCVGHSTEQPTAPGRWCDWIELTSEDEDRHVACHRSVCQRIGGRDAPCRTHFRRRRAIVGSA